MNSFLQELAGELIIYGGMAATRGEVFKDSLKILSHNARIKFGMAEKQARQAAEKGADYYAFGPRARCLSPEEAAALPRFRPSAQR